MARGPLDDPEHNFKQQKQHRKMGENRPRETYGPDPTDHTQMGEPVSSKLKGSPDFKPLDHSSLHGERMQSEKKDGKELGPDYENMRNGVVRQTQKRDEEGYRHKRTLPDPRNPPHIPPDPGRGPKATGRTPEEIARADRQYEKDERDRANGITPASEQDPPGTHDTIGHPWEIDPLDRPKGDPSDPRKPPPDRPNGLRRNPGESDSSWRMRSEGQHLSGGADPRDPNYPTGKPSDPRGPSNRFGHTPGPPNEQRDYPNRARFDKSDPRGGGPDAVPSVADILKNAEHPKKPGETDAQWMERNKGLLKPGQSFKTPNRLEDLDKSFTDAYREEMDRTPDWKEGPPPGHPQYEPGKDEPTDDPSDPRGPAQSKKVDGPDWKGTPPLKAPPKPPTSTAHPAPPKEKPGILDKAPPKIPPVPDGPVTPRKPIPPYKTPGKPPTIVAARKTGLSTYARARAGL